MRKLMAAATLLSATIAYGAAPVEELGSGSTPAATGPGLAAEPARQSPQGGAQPVQSGGQQGLVNLHSELQEMREEVRELRGMVEEQGQELRQLRQRQMDDYQDLDRRLSAMAGTAPASGTEPDSAPALAQSDVSGDLPEEDSGPDYRPVQQQGSASQGEEYDEIFNRLKARKIDEAQAGFKTFVAKYPESPYSANAWYWLGEIYLLQNDLEGAEEAFERVTADFPAHSKVPDAKFKLGKVYHLQGKNDEARALLSEVANSNSRSAALAQTYLRDNF